MSFFLTSTVSMLVVLGIMVLVHEFGHFAVAKLCGVRVEVFSIGFGKRLFGFRHGDTDYRLSLLPWAGMSGCRVKLPGKKPREIRGNSAPTRGGSGFLLAWRARSATSSSRCSS